MRAARERERRERRKSQADGRTTRQPLVGRRVAHRQSLALPRRTTRPEREVLGGRMLHRDDCVVAAAVVGAGRRPRLQRRRLGRRHDQLVLRVLAGRDERREL